MEVVDLTVGGWIIKVYGWGGLGVKPAGLPFWCVVTTIYYIETPMDLVEYP